MADSSVILDNRELAVALWCTALFVLGLFGFKNLRQELSDLIKNFFNRKIFLTLMAVFTPLICLLAVLAHYQVLEAYMLKTTIFWILTAGIVMSFKVAEIKSKDSFFRMISTRLFRATLIFEFVINLYVFPLPVELILIPAVWLMIRMLAVIRTQKCEDNEEVRKLLEWVLAFTGMVIFAFTLMKILAHPEAFFALTNLKLFLLPILLTLLHMPAVYFLALYFAYERLFTTLGALYPTFDASRRIKIACVKKCNVYIKPIHQMRPFLVREIIPSLREEEILQLVRKFQLT